MHGRRVDKKTKNVRETLTRRKKKGVALTVRLAQHMCWAPYGHQDLPDLGVQLSSLIHGSNEDVSQ